MISELLISGSKASEVSREYGLNESMIRRWRKEYEERSGNFDAPKKKSDQELRMLKLEKELKDVKLERDILKKAVSIFSKSDR